VFFPKDEFLVAVFTNVVHAVPIITDFAPADEIEEAKQLWLMQITDLKAKIGAV